MRLGLYLACDHLSKENSPANLDSYSQSYSTPIPPLPTGWFNWVKPFFKTPDTFVLNHGSLDGFFFLRYLKVLRNTFLVGMLIAWPILFPIHITGGNELSQLDILTIGKISDKARMFAHVAVAYMFFGEFCNGFYYNLTLTSPGFVLFTITRECFYYIGIRQAYLSSPHYAKRLSSRTLLITSIPDRYLDEARLRKLYGDSVKRVWIPRTAKALVKLVEEREETAMRLEKAEILLIKKAHLARKKQLGKNPPSTSSSAEQCAAESSSSYRTDPSSEQYRSNSPREVDISQNHEQEHSETQDHNKTEYPRVSQTATHNTHDFLEKSAEDPEYVHPYGLDPDLPDVRGSVAAQWVPANARPHHRPLHNFFRRVDTIRWCRMRLKDLNLEIWKLRRQVRRGDGDTLPAAFIEFETQEAAQAAHQIVAHHRPLQLAPRLLGVRPDEVVWSALRMRWWERIIRRFLIMGLVAVAIVFWSIPSAMIGIVSNIDFLSGIIFLRWIKLLPKPILGFLQGFIPAIALSFWMSLVPAMLRCKSTAPFPCSYTNNRSLRCCSWNPVSCASRALYAEGLLCFPGCSGFPDHNIDLGRFRCYSQHYQEAHVGTRPPSHQPAKGFKLLSLVYSCSMSGHWRHRPLAHIRAVPTLYPG